MLKKITLIFAFFICSIQTCSTESIDSTKIKSIFSDKPGLLLGRDTFFLMPRIDTWVDLDRMFKLFLEDWDSFNEVLKPVIIERFAVQKSWRLFFWIYAFEGILHPDLRAKCIEQEFLDFFKDPVLHGLEGHLPALKSPLEASSAEEPCDESIEPERIKEILEALCKHKDFESFSQDASVSAPICNAFFDLLYPTYTGSSEDRATITQIISRFLNFDKTSDFTFKKVNGKIQETSISKQVRKMTDTIELCLFGSPSRGPRKYGRDTPTTLSEYKLLFDAMHPALKFLFEEYVTEEMT
jgi:hypothetical protein